MSQPDDIEALTEAFREPEAPRRAPKSPKGDRLGWQPRLGPKGTQVLLDHRKYILLHGERGSLKTGIALNKCIMSCYENVNQLAIICAITRGAATEGGAWEKLNTLALPEWHDGIGLQFTEPRMDDQKNRYVFVANKWGGWSKIVLKSMPFGANIQQRIKGMEPGFFFFDELTEAASDEYFTKPIQQLRRPGIPHPQFVGACNPPESGEQHWVYRKFFEEPLNESTGEWDDNFGVYHIPISENVWWSEEQIKKYRETLMVEARNDPTAVDRLIYGKWVARPTGQGMFKEYFMPNIHIIGDAAKGIGLKPIPGYPIILGYDLGQVFSSVTLMQCLPKMWIVFDEVDYLGERILYKNLALEIVERMKYWSKLVGYEFQHMHITDESAINQWRPGGDGSYDAWEFEKEFNRASGKPVKMLGCPKGHGSVSARVRTLQGKLYQEEIFISAVCRNAVQMFMQLESEPNDADKPKRSKWVHKFDSVSYPIFKIEVGGSRKYLPSGQVAPTIWECGQS